MQQFGRYQGKSGHCSDVVDLSLLTQRRLSSAPIIALRDQRPLPIRSPRRRGYRMQDEYDAVT